MWYYTENLWWQHWNFQYKDDNSECFAAFGESKYLETGENENKIYVEDNLNWQFIEDDSVCQKGSRRDLSEEKKFVV